MANKEFDVYIEDKEGNVILDETVKSQSNGFIDLWLPRDKTYSVTIKQGEKTVKSDLKRSFVPEMYILQMVLLSLFSH